MGIVVRSPALLERAQSIAAFNADGGGNRAMRRAAKRRLKTAAAGHAGRMRNQRGATLVELLIVLIAVGVLLLLLGKSL